MTTTHAFRVVLFAAVAGCLVFSSGHLASSQSARLQPNTLCARDERVVFACALHRPAKIVSICASKNLTRETGYLQYRFGTPTKIELEFP